METFLFYIFHNLTPILSSVFRNLPTLFAEKLHAAFDIHYSIRYNKDNY